MKRMTSFAIAVLLCGISLAEIPQVISYQGKVTDTSGNPVADGPYPMQFRIYDAATGGTLLWNSNNQTVAVSGGIFSVLLGDSPQPALLLDFSTDYWLLVIFNGVNQTPRQRLGSSGYAYMASGLVAGTEVSGSVTSGTIAAIKGTNTATEGPVYGIYGQSASTIGYGVRGEALATTGANYGVIGQCASDAGIGVYGRPIATTGTTFGVVGLTYTSSGQGVRGVNYATTGYTCAVHGLAMSSAGRAVSGECNGTGGIGVVGWAGATTGGANGVFGYSASPTGAGVVGQAAATTGGPHGVYGTSAATEGRGVTGIATAATGMNYGVYGQNDSAAGSGVYGSGYYGVYGDGQYGVYGDGYYGVIGHTTSTYGYGVYYSGGLAGTGTKSCVVKTSKGPTLMYCQESPENWFEDFGEGQLMNGRCHIELDALFLETVTVDAANPMHVFVQPNDEACVGLVVKKGAHGFDVVSPMNGEAAGLFTYRVVAKRKGFETKRLDYCAAAEGDSYLFPELREKEQAEREASKVRHEEDRTRHEQERVRMEQERRRMNAESARRDEERVRMDEETGKVGSR